MPLRTPELPKEDKRDPDSTEFQEKSELFTKKFDVDADKFDLGGKGVDLPLCMEIISRIANPIWYRRPKIESERCRNEDNESGRNRKKRRSAFTRAKNKWQAQTHYAADGGR